MYADYNENLSQFKEVVKEKFNGTTFKDGNGLLPRYPTEQYQARDNILSDREVLELAAEQISIEGLTAGEKDGLRIFKERLDKQREFEEHRKELGQLYKEQQFGANVDREEAQKTLAWAAGCGNPFSFATLKYQRFGNADSHTSDIGHATRSQSL